MPFRWKQSGLEMLASSFTIELELNDIDIASRPVASCVGKRGKQGDKELFASPSFA